MRPGLRGKCCEALTTIHFFLYMRPGFLVRVRNVLEILENVGPANFFREFFSGFREKLETLEKAWVSSRHGLKFVGKVGRATFSENTTLSCDYEVLISRRENFVDSLEEVGPANFFQDLFAGFRGKFGRANIVHAFLL